MPKVRTLKKRAMKAKYAREKISPAMDAMLKMAAERFKNYKSVILSKEEWDILESYDGPVVSGDPSGKLPKNFRNL